MRLKHFIIGILISCTFSFLRGQDMVFPKLRLGITPTSFVNNLQGVQTSLDFGVYNLYNIALETAYIYRSINNDSEKGFRVRPGIETFLVRSRLVALNIGLHSNYRYSARFMNQTEIASNGEFNYLFYNDYIQTHLIGANLSENLMFKFSDRHYLELGSSLGIGKRYILTKRQHDVVDVTRLLRIENYLIAYIHINFSIALWR